MSKNLKDEIIQDLNEINSNLGYLNVKIKLLDNVLEKLIDILEIPDTIESYVTKIDNTIIMLNRTLVAVSIIPSIKTQSRTLNYVVSGIKQVIHPQRIKIEMLDNTYIEPMRDAVNDFHERVELIYSHIDKYQDNMNFLIKYINDNEINGNVLIKFKDTVDKINEYLKTLINLIDKGEQDAKRLIHNTQEIIRIKERVEKIYDDLEFLYDILNPIDEALDKKITITYWTNIKVKVPKTKKVKCWKNLWEYAWKTVTVWEWEWKLEPKNITFSINQILQGLEGLYDDLMEKLREEVNKILDPLLESIDLDINLDELIGLEKIEEEINKIRSLIDIEMFSSFNDILLNIDQSIESLSKIKLD